MEENKLNLLEKENAKLKKSVATLEKKLEEQSSVLLAAQDAAKQREAWWLESTKKLDTIKDDVKTIQKMFNVLSNLW